MKQADDEGEVQEGRVPFRASGETRVVNFVLPEMTFSRLIWFQMHETLPKVMEAEERLSVESLSPRGRNIEASDARITQSGAGGSSEVTLPSVARLVENGMLWKAESGFQATSAVKKRDRSMWMTSRNLGG